MEYSTLGRELCSRPNGKLLCCYKKKIVLLLQSSICWLWENQENWGGITKKTKMKSRFTKNPHKQAIVCCDVCCLFLLLSLSPLSVQYRLWCQSLSFTGSIVSSTLSSAGRFWLALTISGQFACPVKTVLRVQFPIWALPQMWSSIQSPSYCYYCLKGWYRYE